MSSSVNMKHTTVCYIERDGKYLMIHRVKKQNDANHDKWIGIGGKLEPGESPHDCVRREVKEETGLTLGYLKYRGFITFISNEFGTEYMHLFSSQDFSGEVKENCDEGVLEWIKKTDLLKIPMWEGDKIFLDLLDRDVPFFSLKLVYQDDKLIDHSLDY